MNEEKEDKEEIVLLPLKDFVPSAPPPTCSSCVPEGWTALRAQVQDAKLAPLVRIQSWNQMLQLLSSHPVPWKSRIQGGKSPHFKLWWFALRPELMMNRDRTPNFSMMSILWHHHRGASSLDRLCRDMDEPTGISMVLGSKQSIGLMDSREFDLAEIGNRLFSVSLDVLFPPVQTSSDKKTKGEGQNFGSVRDRERKEEQEEEQEQEEKEQEEDEEAEIKHNEIKTKDESIGTCPSCVLYEADFWSCTYTCLILEAYEWFKAYQIYKNKYQPRPLTHPKERVLIWMKPMCSALRLALACLRMVVTLLLYTKHECIQTPTFVRLLGFMKECAKSYIRLRVAMAYPFLISPDFDTSYVPPLEEEGAEGKNKNQEQDMNKKKTKKKKKIMPYPRMELITGQARP